MTTQEARDYVYSLITKADWGSHDETEDVLRELVAMLDEENDDEKMQDQNLSLSDLSSMFDACQITLQENAYTDVRKPSFTK